MPRRIVLRSQAREMIHDVMTFFKNEALEGLQYDIKAAQKRTAAATGVSIRTIQNIARAASVPGASIHEAFRTPGKKRVGLKKVTALNSYQQGVIKRCIQSFHNTDNELPTVDRLSRKLKQTAGFQGSPSSLRRIMKELGFKWRRTEDKRQVVIEHSHIRLKRIEYLQALTLYREEGRPIVFVDSSFLETKKISDDANGRRNRNKERVVIVHAATDEGFLPKTLLMFKAGWKHDNNRHYDKWLRTKLIPNLAENAVVVVGKTPYFNKLEEALPASTSKRSEMESWLYEKKIPFKPDTLKPELYKTVCAYKDCFKKYKLDGILAEKNHPVLRFPGYHPELNPLDMAWTAIKSYVVEKHGAKNIEMVKKNVQEKVDAMAEEFRAICQQIKDIEIKYRQNDVFIDQLTDEVTVHASDNESDCETDDSASANERDDETSSDEELVPKKEAVIIQCNVCPDSVIAT